ncbi:LysE family translocator [Acinetobacter soli]|uniref:LysE family translocator n=1 Tax=Acinetobacter soli TaxID=487316 RepID=UPI00124FE0A6|nr:LysE family translocator [Acinetobacter soli]
MLTHYWPEFLSLAIVHLLAVILPGPDFAISVRQSLRYGHLIGCLTAIGIGMGISVHVLYTLVGVGFFIQKNEWLMLLFKSAGALYLCYLGWKLITSKSSGVIDLEQPASAHAKMSKWQAISTGFMTNALNPKATIFFLAIFTTLVSPNTPTNIQIFYGVWMCVVTALWFILVSLLFSRASIRQAFLKRETMVERGIGVVLMGMAIKLIMTSV